MIDDGEAARAPVAWRERLASAYDDLVAPAECLEAAARELPFDPMQAPVVPVAEVVPLLKARLTA